MPPPSLIPGTPQDWMMRSRAKLALALAPLPSGGVWEDLCFMAHQAAELAIKAVYMQHGWMFPYIHDLDQLLSGLQTQGLTIPPKVQVSRQLTPYAVEGRYPSIAPQVTQPEYDDAVRIAQDVVDWAESLVP